MKSFPRKTSASLPTLILFLLTFLCLSHFNSNAEAVANGRVIVIDGMNRATTIDQWGLYDHPSTDYLYNAINSDWRRTLGDEIGPVQPFYWSGDPIYTNYAVQSLTDILRAAYSQSAANNAPLVILSHSWGTVLAYIVLHENPDIVVDKLITMGSPLNVSLLSPVGIFTREKLVLQGIFSIDPLPNVRSWNNYWTDCDWISESISACNNYDINSSGEDIETCHSAYFADSGTWNTILSDARDTQYPLSISNTPSFPSAPADVTFSVSGTLLNELNIVSFSWNFGDGQTGSGQTTSHFYKTPQTYTVTLTMTDSGGGTHVYTKTVVIRPPEINVSYPNGFDDLYREFSTPSSSYVTNYSWNYGDGSPPENDRNGDHTYATSGYYTVTLTLTLDDSSTIQSQAGIFVGSGTRYIQGHTIYGDETWGGETYVIQGSIIVAQGGRLTIEPGTLVKLSGSSQITVYGTLTATGVTFTWADGVNQWGGIKFDGAGSTNSRLENCVIEHGNGNIAGYNRGMIYITDSSPTITGCTINNNNASYGINISNGSPVISNSTISGFTSYGLYYSGSTVIDATNNYWGDPSGPYDPSDDRATGGLYNPMGKGDKVSNKVNYYPWINATTYDADHDGYTGATDCNDNNASINPGAPEVCNGIDDNCNGQIDEGVINTYYRDADADSYGNPSVSSQACSTPSGYVSDNTDCDDTNASINPATRWYPDNDGDGYGNPTIWLQQCLQPAGFVLDNTDPDDNDPNIHPGGPVVRIDETYYLTLQEAYDAANSGDAIACQATSFNEDLYIDLNKTVTLQGGYNNAFTAVTGKTTLNGNLNIISGTIAIGDFKVQ